MDRNYRLIIILLFLCVMSLIMASCKSSKTNCDAYGIRWENPRIDSLAVIKDERTYIPFIPVIDAKSFHFDGTEKGKYVILLKEGNDIVEERTLVLK
jgi:hypothetical protein